jgi:hypothetical protein
VNFENETDLEAHLFRSVPHLDRLLGWVVAKATFRTGPNGAPERDLEDPVPVLLEAVETPFGEVPIDNALRKEGVDIFVLGRAHAPGGKPATRVDVTLSVGEFSARLAVFGKRKWEKGFAKIRMSAPEPFLDMPITWDRAFGGASLQQNRPVLYEWNPEGKGWIVEKGQVDGTELPNIEDPAHLIQTWKDTPKPAGFAPLPVASRLRAEGSVTQDEETGFPKIEPSFFNHAPPALRMPELRGGERVTLTGMTPDGEWSFTIPPLKCEAEVTREEKSTVVPAVVDTLCLLPEERRFYVIHRASFYYVFVPEEIRTTRFYAVSRAG